MSNIKSINENSLNNKCITMSELSNKTNEKDDLVDTFNDNKKVKRVTGRKRKNERSNNKKCCKCKHEISINDSIEIKNKEELINKSKGFINMNEIKFMTFKEHQIICKGCLDIILKDEDCKNIIKQMFFINKKRGRKKSKVRKKNKQNNINNKILEENDDKGHFPSINNGHRQNSLMLIINEYENCLSYIKQYLFSVFRVVVIFGENYDQFLRNMNNKCYTFFQSYIQTKSILQIMFNTGKIIASNFKNISDNIINCLSLIKENFCINEASKKIIQDQIYCLATNVNQIMFKLDNFFNNLNVLISFLNGKGFNSS
jgi:hypothetical protein